MLAGLAMIGVDAADAGRHWSEPVRDFAAKGCPSEGTHRLPQKARVECAPSSTGALEVLAVSIPTEFEHLAWVPKEPPVALGLLWCHPALGAAVEPESYTQLGHNPGVMSYFHNRVVVGFTRDHIPLSITTVHIDASRDPRLQTPIDCARAHGAALTAAFEQQLPGYTFDPRVYLDLYPPEVQIAFDLLTANATATAYDRIRKVAAADAVHASICDPQATPRRVAERDRLASIFPDDERLWTCRHDSGFGLALLAASERYRDLEKQPLQVVVDLRLKQPDYNGPEWLAAPVVRKHLHERLAAEIPTLPADARWRRLGMCATARTLGPDLTAPVCPSAQDAVQTLLPALEIRDPAAQRARPGLPLIDGRATPTWSGPGRAILEVEHPQFIESSAPMHDWVVVTDAPIANARPDHSAAIYELRRELSALEEARSGLTYALSTPRGRVVACGGYAQECVAQTSFESMQDAVSRAAISDQLAGLESRRVEIDQQIRALGGYDAPPPGPTSRMVQRPNGFTQHTMFWRQAVTLRFDDGTVLREVVDGSPRQGLERLPRDKVSGPTPEQVASSLLTRAVTPIAQQVCAAEQDPGEREWCSSLLLGTPNGKLAGPWGLLWTASRRR